MVAHIIKCVADEVPLNGSKVVVQEYITRPLLIEGRKFDVRLYLMISSVDPLQLFIHNEGIVNICAEDFTIDCDQFNRKFVHLSNYSINKNHDKYDANKHRWKLSRLWKYLNTKFEVDTDLLWEKTKYVCLNTVLCGLDKIREECKDKIDCHYKSFKLLSVDILYDEDLKPWLLEVRYEAKKHIDAYH